MIYTSRAVHPISPRDDDFGPDVDLSENATSDAGTLAKALRKVKILSKGEKCRFRVEGSRIAVFPYGTRFSHMIHAWILTPKGSAGTKRAFHAASRAQMLKKVNEK